MSFCKRSFHSFLGQNNTNTMPFNNDQPCESIFGLKTLSHHRSGSSENGLMLCTEYLGFESYDMRMSDNEVEEKMTCHAEAITERVETKRKKTKEENVVATSRDRKNQFPPPLSSLNARGERSFYLRPVRKDGRLELTRVMIDRPEIFHASRANGRLRLHLVGGIYDGNLQRQKGVDNPIRASCDSEEETMDLEDEPKGLDRLHLESRLEIYKDNDAACDQVVALSMTNDNSGARSLRCKSKHEVLLNSDDDVAHFDDEHDPREWRYKYCTKSRNYDENDYHRRHIHHHIHPYHHYSSNNNMHLWSRSYVKTM
ncbi:hypothetical protein EUTSA_v10023602mg [Eutrema salsugineum]|uniref:FAF domain-containing protein n=1 Tax=Eutrema salsugineum TaxID=72664 RepID=V4KF47_EUTSA|nr:uncharacterized protein LOC18009731 [Eutrema salsugineum]ESQ29774.1 hypothetical protein EUTSA_v10023602mg [Eutrema salsugineum]